ncbi:MAG: O-antigen ligase family protein [Actinomycetota bacterium]|nr:O-antigen ligase family protein [Actinomycetota bacterium]
MTRAAKRHQELLVYSGVALTSLYVGLLVARNQETMAMSMLALLALGGLVILVNLPAKAVFTGWLFLSPIFQVSADATSAGRGLTWALYIAPSLIFVWLTLAQRRRVIAFTRLDWLPAAYVLYVVASMLTTSTFIQSDPAGSAKSIVTLVAVGAIAYYFLTFGPGVDIPLPTIVVTLLAAALIQSAMAALEITSGWRLWGGVGWLQEVGGARASSTLANPGVLGMFLGVGIVFAVAILTWGAPRRLRRLAWIVLLAATPALFLTLTRGPILATAVAVVALLLLTRARLVGLGVLATAALAIAFLYPSLQNTSAYQERATNAKTVQVRVVLRDLSLQLAAEKPLLGWGRGKFDEAKRASEVTNEGISIKAVLATTSHDTYLTLLVELGAIGLLLYALPFLVLVFRGLRQRGPPSDSWLLAGSLASLLVIYITASTLDFRFFSFAQLIPFVFLAMLRRLTAPATAPSS